MSSSAKNLKTEDTSIKNHTPIIITSSPTLEATEFPSFLSLVVRMVKTTLEHVSQFILQCGEASANDILKLRMFPLSLSGTDFSWFSSLTPNSLFTWAQLE
jgi:hypothetical protein